jgi:SET domain-containing protein
MFIVDAIAKSSNLHGIGAFANENIKAGRLVWQYQSWIDHSWTVPMLASWIKLKNRRTTLAEIYNFGWESSMNPGVIVLSSDCSKYTNHSLDPNTTRSLSEKAKWEYSYVAVKDIRAGEEITQNYSELGESQDGLSLWNLLSDELSIPRNTFYDSLTR